MVVPLGGGPGMGMPQDAGAPSCVKDRFSKWWWVLMGVYIVVCVGRILATDIIGALLSGMMAVIAWYMVKEDCSKMSQYCVFLFGMMCVMNTVLEFVTLAGALQGRQTQRTESKPLPAATGSSSSSTSYTITIEKHPFFDKEGSLVYNQQSLMMILCPLAAFLGFLLSYFSYNAFPNSMFSEEGGGDGAAENQSLGGGRLGGFGGAGGYSSGGNAYGGGGAATGGGRPVQASAGPRLFEGSGQRLGGS